MSKVKGIFRYEFKNIIRSKLIWVTGLLAIFALMYIYKWGIRVYINEGGKFPGGTLSYIGLSWVFVNFTTLPILIISFNTGKGRNEIFGTTNLKPSEMLIGKLGAVLTVGGIFFLLNILVPLILAICDGLSLEYMAYLMKYYLIINVIAFLAVIILGFFIGQVLHSFLGDVVCFLFIIALFVVTCNIRKNFLTPNILYYTNTFASTFSYFNFTDRFKYHILFWTAIIALCILAIYMLEYKAAYNKILKINLILILAISTIAGTACYKEIAAAPVKYRNITKKVMDGIIEQGLNLRALSIEYIGNPNSKTPLYCTYYAKDDCGYYVSSYDMDMDNKENFSNRCTMEVSVTKDSLTTMEFGLYGKLKIKKLTVDGKAAAFTQEDTKFSVQLPQQKNNGDKVKIYVEYEGSINTTDMQGVKMFFVYNSSASLTGTFEWYPKLNDKQEKNYTIKMNEGKQQIYSNLEVSKNGDSALLKGSDSEIFILYGELKEKTYNGYTFVAPEGDFLTNVQCDKAISLLGDIQKYGGANGNKNYEDENSNIPEKGFKRIILGPFILNGNRSIYKDTYLDNKFAW